MRTIAALSILTFIIPACGNRTVPTLSPDPADIGGQQKLDQGRKQDYGPPLPSDLFVPGDLKKPGSILKITGSGTEEVLDLATDFKGVGLAVLGSFDGPASFGGTALKPSQCSTSKPPCRSIFVAMLGDDLKPTWVKAISGTGDIRGAALFFGGSPSIWVVGSFKGKVSLDTFSMQSKGSYDIFVLRLDGNGKVVFASSLGTAGDDHAYDVTGTKDTAYIAGTISGPVTIGKYAITSKTPDMLIAQVDYKGKFTWGVAAGGLGKDAGLSLVREGDALYVLGRFQGSATLGTHSVKGQGGSDLLVARLDLKGGTTYPDSFSWVYPIVDAGSDGGGAITSSEDHTLRIMATLTGDTKLPGKSLKSRGGKDLLYLQLGPNGKAGGYQWFGGAGDDFGNSICRSFFGSFSGLGGDMVLAGHFRSSKMILGKTTIGAQGGDSAWLAHLDRKAGLIRVAATGSGGKVTVGGVAHSHTGKMTFGGSFSGQPTLFGEKLKATGGKDAYIAQIDW